jgi:hypothetical protein
MLAGQALLNLRTEVSGSDRGTCGHAVALGVPIAAVNWTLIQHNRGGA